MPMRRDRWILRAGSASYRGLCFNPISDGRYFLCFGHGAYLELRYRRLPPRKSFAASPTTSAPHGYQLQTLQGG